MKGFAVMILTTFYSAPPIKKTKPVKTPRKPAATTKRKCQKTVSKKDDVIELDDDNDNYSNLSRNSKKAKEGSDSEVSDSEVSDNEVVQVSKAVRFYIYILYSKSI